MSKRSDRPIWTDSRSLNPTDRPKHRAHRHQYDEVRERVTRAHCGERLINCLNWQCPRHDPERYTRVAKHRRVMS